MPKRISSLAFILSLFLTALDGRAQEKSMESLVRKSFDPALLAKDFPPILRDPNIREVFKIADAVNSTYSGTLTYTRWATSPLPENLSAKSRTEARAVEGFFTYGPPIAGTVDWHLNFADANLFGYYGTGLFAQDEMQVAEHPILASLREALRAQKLTTLTIENERPTPILVENVQRRVRVAVDPNAKAGRPQGLYGNHFGSASAETVRRAVHRIEPPTTSNIIAIAAPAGGQGAYTSEQIRFILETAYTGFAAAKKESAAAAPRAKVIIHTGYWGCGAFGGNRVLMATLQILAAQMANIDELVFHTGDAGGDDPFRQAKTLVHALVEDAPSTDAPVTRLKEKNFRWGTSDGN